ncbi:hypothetical protein [Actinomycetospora straminea]|uniref:hypothetical protein n=1 Tax=Actinomycetospora straminea TaxID=663607 RepID=UPI0031ED0E8E
MERTVVEGTVLDEQHDAPWTPDERLDDLVPDLDDDLGDARAASPPAGDDEWAEAWVMDEGGESGVTGDAVGELADDADQATVTTPADRNPGWREGSEVHDSGRWVGAGRRAPGTPG